MHVGIGWRQPHYGELLARRPVLGFLEVHSENFFAQGGAALAVLERGRAHYDISLHGVGLSLGSAVGLDPWHLNQLAQLVQRIDPVRISDHASFARGRWSGQAEAQTIHAADLLPIPFSTEALDTLCANVQHVQEHLQRRFMVENVSSYVRWLPQPEETLLVETEFLNTLAARTGCALLVDVNNIYVNALNARLHGAVGDPVQHCLDWLDRVAPQQVAEIHLAGHCHVLPQPGEDARDEIVIDDHSSRVCAEVWQIYRHAISRFGAVPTLIEWDTDIPALDVLLDEAAQAHTVATASLQARQWPAVQFPDGAANPNNAPSQAPHPHGRAA
ncbi:MAG: DUF692 domain-containing protein [Rhodoferax sp.]|uniref:DUF692 domain-containing protein n=1 Tax=Rhodoferax sp. TaxID=50421 RepID=UPI002603A24D|nr:DUF692 domain-containing protein [Rhodoferax sp.]MDD2881612.1 DUF692 domain-containing protein [Rhodoferax sp.]